MSKKKNGYGKLTIVEAKMFLSPAFISLGKKGTSPSVSSCSHAVLMMLLGKRDFGFYKNRKRKKIYERTDDNELTLTYKELAIRGISQPRATRAFDELLAKGFISIFHRGGAYDKDKNYYSLEEDYLMWRPGRPPIRSREKDIKRGFQGKGLGVVKKLKNKNNTRQQGTPTHTSTGDTHKKDTHVSEGHPNQREICLNA